MSERKQRLKGAANEVAGKTKGSAAHATGDRAGELKAAGQVAKGKAQKAIGSARSSAKQSGR
jgi:uncharacterized protein YjbJ (UPF0337 family)